ncbi:hypothetical protein ACSBR2_041899 [Camellia fascicularis]
MAKSSPVSVLKAYWFPLILFASSMFYQHLILPRSYPPSHDDVLGIKRYSSMEQVTEAYEKFSSKWNSGTEVLPITEFIKIRYAFELLTNPLWKRNYDIFGIDEHIHVLDSIKERHAGTIFSEIDLPLLESAPFDPGDHDFEVITSGNFLSKFENSKALLIQVFSFGSNRSAQFSNNWKKIASLLDGMANTGMVELGEVQLATYLAEKTFTGQPSFQNGLRSLIAFPSGCNTANCLIRFGVESAPAIVFLKEHGVKPVVYHGPANNSWFVDIMEQNKHQELPQLRSVTSMELGCDARGYSRAGNETAIWYCLILAGRSSPELNKMRATLRRIQEALSIVDNDQPSSPAAVALKEKRLTFTWLDGEAQQRYCFFHTQTENSYETCGPRRDII